MIQKINEKEKNQNCDKSKVYISHNENKRSFDCDNFFARFNFKIYCNLNEKNMKQKTNKSSKKRCFNEFATLY